MIYITGDTHGNWMRRLNRRAFPEQRNMTREDFVIICGDFGIWDDSKEERYNLNWLEGKSFTTLFVDGNHENFDLLNGYPISEWHGGKIRVIRPHIFHLMRGQVFDIGGKRFFTFGGACSHDMKDGILEIGDPRIKRWRNSWQRRFRINHISWWKEEMPTEEEMKEGDKNLGRVNNKVDFIVSHCGATSSIALHSMGEYKPDILTDYFEKIRSRVEFQKWYMGHYHKDYDINGKETILYEQVIKIL
ncbi:MAG TPA: metallophosphatase family protein [Candidatus Blautia stercoripullorum]|uniref:Metallophosphatase family protein n=1 Tax=Candidatus Blautia stercoripullorum TaxID=2838502 RepID=A0A9D2RCX2_9FIRM|nr:metallophosphatase family protein [Candidatus Blautia stercoripullorum]